MNGPLSNRLYKLDELNRREREAEAEQTRNLLLAGISLAMFIALVAIVRMHG